MVTCPNCGRENADNFNFCLDCGYDLKSYRDSMDGTEAAASAPAPGPGSNLGSGAPTESMSAQDVASSAAAPGVAMDPDAPPFSAPEEPTLVNSPEPAPPAAAAPTPAPAAAVPAAVPAPITAPAAPAAAPADSPMEPTETSALKCPSCSCDLGPNMKFCGECGFRLDGGAAPAAPAADAPAAGRTMFMHAADLQAPAEKICKLVTIDQTGKEGMTYSLKSGETLCGRVNGIILFFDDPYVSPTHCLFAFTDGKLHVTDKESLNGCYVRISGERALDDGDHLRIGRQLFRYESLAAVGNEVTRAEGDDAKIWGSPDPGAFGRLLQILEDGRTGEIRLLSGEACNLGREQGEIVFPTDGFISGRHCLFFQSGAETRVKDLGSSNGTYVRVRGTTTMGHGDFLLVGNQMLRIEIV